MGNTLPGVVSPWRAFFLGLSVISVGCQIPGCEEKKGPARVTRGPKETKAPGSEYVGRKACAPCHDDVLESYAFSQHDLSLTEPSGPALAAPFAGEEERGLQISATFSKDGDKPIITSGETYPVRYAIGTEPLQGFAVETKDGRTQIFSYFYDTRERSAGGKRWFLLPETDVPPSDPMHFLGSAQNFDTECAECHSTAVSVAYDWKANRASSKFLEIDVSCEACHGPASRHVELAKEHTTEWPASVQNFGFTRALAPYRLRRFVTAPGEKVARLTGEGNLPPEQTEEVLSCAPCHSERISLRNASQEAPTAFEDGYLLSLLENEHYHPDGQVKGQTYSYGSFLMSAHARADLVCSDCHNPHSATLRKPVVELCVTCHDQATYDAKSHHLHQTDAEVVPSCVDCHMPTRFALDVDIRSDHGLILPRPDLSETLRTPNPCGSCHAEKGAAWATRALEDAFGEKRRESFAPAFFASDARDAEAPNLLKAVVQNRSFPELVRASALVRWAQTGRKMHELDDAIKTAAQAETALMRRAAAEASLALPQELYDKHAPSLFKDPKRSVRFSAARALLLREKPKTALDGAKTALAELRAVAEARAHRPEFLHLLASALRREGKTSEALEVFRTVTERFPYYAPIYADFVGALTEANKLDEAEGILSQGLAQHADDPELNFRKGRALAQPEQVKLALPYLKKAFEGASGLRRREAGYVYGVSLQATGDWAEALAVLRIITKEYPEAEEAAAAMDLISSKRSAK